MRKSQTRDGAAAGGGRGWGWGTGEEHAQVLRRMCLESLKIREQSSAAEGVVTTRWSVREDKGKGHPGAYQPGGGIRTIF